MSASGGIRYYGLTGDANDLVGFTYKNLNSSDVHMLSQYINSFNELLNNPNISQAEAAYLSAAYNTQSNVSDVLASDGAFESLDGEDKDLIRNEIRSRAGISVNSDGSYSDSLFGSGNTIPNAARFTIPLTGSLGGYEVILYPTSSPYIKFFRSLGSLGTSDQFSNMNGLINWTPSRTGIRSDLVYGGLNDANTWSARFSNIMEDGTTIGYLKDYHISTTNTNVVLNEYYVNDYMWTIYDQDGNLVREQRGSREFITQFLEAGNFTITAKQRRTTVRGIYVTYDICEYLFDMKTKCLLYGNEIIGTGSNGQYITIEKTTESDYVEVDESTWRINDLSEHETNGGAVERIR